MTDRDVITALNQLADTLNEAAVKLNAISRMRSGSPLARMVEQCGRAAATMPEPREPASWIPPKL
ncbi:hypothetical protein ACVWXO_008441 [Bradyrhizobium sp. LM2.7]